MQAPIVIKVSGHELDDMVYLDGLASVIAALDVPFVVVHGGGKEISTLQTRMGIEPRYVDGVRVTDADSLTLVEMVLCGVVNKRLVRHLLMAGVDALGMSGVDRAFIRAVPMQLAGHNMGFTGEVTDVRPALLTDLLNLGITPVIAPICLGQESALNVNADHVAGAVAVALGAARLVFLSNVAGVLQNDSVLPSLTPAQTDRLIAEGVISGGMIPKVRTALAALDAGVREAVITNLEGLRLGGGTAFRAANQPV